MSRVFVFMCVVGAAAALHQSAVRANGSATPSPASSSSSMPVLTPEQIAAQAYNSGIGHKNKGSSTRPTLQRPRRIARRSSARRRTNMARR